MKLFGGGGGRKKTTGSGSPKSAPKAATGTHKTAPKPQGKGGKPAKAGKGGKVKTPLTKNQKRKRIIIAAVIVAVLCVGLATAAWIFIRPPEIKNDPTIHDTENGDKVDVNELLNAGTRVDDLFTFVVCAVDEDETRTDAIMVARMDTKKKTINIMNIPRDTMCNNGYSGASRKINAAYGIKTGGKGGNIEQTKKEVERLLGFKPDKYVVVNFDGIAAIVDAIGGVDYEVPFRMQYDDPSQDLHIDLYAGMQHLNGKQTVEFLRWRHSNDYSMQYETGDQGRVENQQKFLKKIASDLFQMKNILKIKDISDAIFNNVKTDFTAGQILWMGMQAMNIKNENIQFFTLPGYGQMSTAGSDPVAYSFYFPYYQQTLDLVNQYMNPFAEPITTLDMVDGPESYSGGGHVSTDPGDDYVWPDSGSSSGSDSNEGGSGSGAIDPEQGDSNGSGDGTGTGTTPGTPTTPGTSDGEPGGSTGGETGGGETGGSTGGETGGGESGGGTGGETGGGESGGGTGGETGGGESGGGSTGGETGGGESGGGSIDPEA